MSKLNTKEFAAAVDVKLGTVKAHLSRGKLERDASGYIDTETEKNRRYIQDQTKGKGLFNKSAPTPGPKTVSAPGSKKSSEFVEPAAVFSDNRTAAQINSDKIFTELELRKKQADTERSERDAELKRIEIEKKTGNLLPIELVQKILYINIQGILKNFEGESENIAGIFSEVLGGSRKDLAEIVSRQKASLKIAIDKAKSETLLEINLAIDEYAEIRSRGERKI